MTRAFYLLPLLIFLVLAEYFFVSLRSGHDVQELPSAMIEKPSPQFDLAGLGKDKPDDSAKLLATFGDPYRQVGVDRDGRVGLDFGVYGVPETYVLDSAGRIR